MCWKNDMECIQNILLFYDFVETYYEVISKSPIVRGTIKSSNYILY